MTKEEIIRIAYEQGIDYIGVAGIQRFADAIRFATKEEDARICEAAKPAGGRMWTPEQAACFDCLGHVAKHIRASK